MRLIKICHSISSANCEEIPLKSPSKNPANPLINVASALQSDIYANFDNPGITDVSVTPEKSLLVGEFLHQRNEHELLESNNNINDDVKKNQCYSSNDHCFDNDKSEASRMSLKRNFMDCEFLMATKNSTFINSKGTDSSKFLLHQACLLFPTNPAVVFSAVIVDASNLYTRVRISERTYSVSGFNKKNNSKSDRVSSLPLHIAIECKGSFEVLQHLTLAAPEIIAWKDGLNDCNAISSLLYQKRFDLDILSMFIRMNREALLVVDRLQNTSLHVACAQGAPIELVRILYEGNPQALFRRNMLGLTPLQISQQTGLCSIEVNDLLHELSVYPLECNAHHLLDSRQAKRQKVGAM